jgi:Heterokaryon incompatibility protein Het-C
MAPIMEYIAQHVAEGGHLIMQDKAQYLVWTDPTSSDPTHSMLSKDHFRYPTSPLSLILIKVAT